MVGVRPLAALAVVAAAMGLGAAAAGAAVAPGGVGASGTVAVADITCVARCVDTRKATPGAKVQVRGLALDQVSSVVFRGSSATAPTSPRPGTTS
jgi:hypothetical protein